jgi:NAD(P)-dependent dehydrogenase (short-subunit alcohol dehydrogenase family)
VPLRKLGTRLASLSCMGILRSVFTTSGRAPSGREARQNVMIVGASRGLGLDLARTYAARGAQLALCARDELEVARAHAELTDGGARALSAVCDATQPLAMQAFVEAALAEFQHIDVLITCAATIQVGPLEVMTQHDFEEALAQIFWSTYHPTMAVLPHMRSRRRGRLVHVTSFGGKLAVPHMAPYCTAKFAATGFSAALRSELAKDGIHVTTVAPGLLRTGAQVNAPFKGQREKEYLWFSAGVALPLLSLSSERAARRIVRAVERNVPETTLTLGVRLAVIAQALAPTAFSRLLALENRLLPSARGGSVEGARGMDVAAASRSPVVRAVDAYGWENAQQHHAYPGPIHVLRS